MIIKKVLFDNKGNLIKSAYYTEGYLYHSLEDAQLAISNNKLWFLLPIYFLFYHSNDLCYYGFNISTT